MVSDAADVLAIDCGRSSSSWSISGSGFAAGTTAGVDPSRPIEPQIVASVRAALNDSGRRPGILACGSIGLQRPDAAATLAELLDTPISRVKLADHAVTGYLGALGEADGVMIACGTGVVALAVGGGDAARVDGWGWLAGDAGSAYWIGRNALEAAMRGYDGRRQSTLLTELFEDEFDDIELAPSELQDDPQRVARVASYAVRVDEAAHTDPVARSILDKAAAHLAEAVVAAAHRVDLGRHEAPAVCAVGTTFDSARVRERFIAYLAMTWPGFALTEPLGDRLHGAHRLARIDEGPLAARVATAGRG